MSSPTLPTADDKIIKFTNCRLAQPDGLVDYDLWVSATTGRILDHQRAFYKQHAVPSRIVDLRGRILAPGFLDVQLNGGYGFDFSVPSPTYADSLARTNQALVKTGVTSYLPTLTSQPPAVYHAVLPHLAAKRTRNAADGAQSLGAHCEGPFLNPRKNGIHDRAVLQRPTQGLASLEACYGAANLAAETVAMVTLAPELDQAETDSVVGALAARGIVVAAGHSDATYTQMAAAVRRGVTMVTHLFNAIAQPHHRNPGIFGILGVQGGVNRPWFGIIADDIHVHPSFVRVAFNAHPDGTILVTDAMAMLGLPDGAYEWTNGATIVKRGGELTLQGTRTIAGSCVTLVECLTNLINWTDTSIATALRTVTQTPAKMLGLESIKGTLRPGADADLVVLRDGVDADGKTTLVVEEVWKFGVQVYERPLDETDVFSARL
ncbi:N-acetylglucosamine-6-phosphate deacetylase [Geopyxis carbonaria]|nr:N-acetylglucosamine-6-phosphate deacetylase [Geopyxis carbonaria]